MTPSEKDKALWQKDFLIAFQAALARKLEHEAIALEISPEMGTFLIHASQFNGYFYATPFWEFCEGVQVSLPHCETGNEVVGFHLPLRWSGDAYELAEEYARLLLASAKILEPYFKAAQMEWP